MQAQPRMKGHSAWHTEGGRRSCRIGCRLILRGSQADCYKHTQRGAASLGLGSHQREQREGFNHLTALIQYDDLQVGIHCLQWQRSLQPSMTHDHMCLAAGSTEGPSQGETLQLGGLLRHTLTLASQFTGK